MATLTINYKLKRSFSFFFLVVSIAAFGQSVVNINSRQQDSLINARHKQVLNKPLPAFIAAGNEGVVNNDSLKGKITYINLWEASCAPCMAEMSALNKLYDTLRDNPAFQFISLSSDNMQTINSIKKKYHIPYNMAHLDEEGCYQLNGGMGYPTGIITDRKGNVIYTHAGGYTDSASIWHYIFSEEIYPLLIRKL